LKRLAQVKIGSVKSSQNGGKFAQSGHAAVFQHFGKNWQSQKVL
jgi:hypothetical protein